MLLPTFQKLNDSKSVLTTKLLVFLCGFVSTTIAFLLAAIKGNLIILSSSLQGAFAAPIMGVFLLGSLFTFTNSIGVVVGTVFGFVAGSWLSLGANLVKPNYPKLKTSTEFCDAAANLTTYNIYETYLKETIVQTNRFNSTLMASGRRATNLDGVSVFYSMSYMYTFAFGLCVTVVVGLAASVAAGGLRAKVDKRFIVYDVLSVFKKKRSIKEEEDEATAKSRDLEMSDREQLNV